MIQHSNIQLQRLMQYNKPGDMHIRFVPYVDPLTKETHAERQVPEFVMQDGAHLYLPKSATDVAASIVGNYLPGRVPENMYQHDQLAKDWNIIRSACCGRGHWDANLDEWPALDTPIVVSYDGRMDFVVGFMATHQIEEGRSETVFMEYDPTGEFELAANAPTQFGVNGEVRSVRYIPQLFDGVIAWAYLSLEGQLIRPTRQDPEVELFVDCEFDQSTKTLLSVGIVNKMGRVYYAYDAKAADKVGEGWVRDNVLPYLTHVPNLAVVTELSETNQTFYDWLRGVICEEQGGRGDRACVKMRMDYSTDVAFMADIMHQLKEDGIERIGKMPRVTFQIDYVDSYPTNIKNVVRHNAAWDAVALWHHLGYHTFRASQIMMQMGSAGAGRDYVNLWTQQAKDK